MMFDAKRSNLEVTWVATASSSGNLNIWDEKIRPANSKLTFRHGCDVLVVNWHGLSRHLIMSGGADGIIRLWDLRNPHQPIKRYSKFQKKSCRSFSYLKYVLIS